MWGRSGGHFCKRESTDIEHTHTACDDPNSHPARLEVRRRLLPAVALALAVSVGGPPLPVAVAVRDGRAEAPLDLLVNPEVEGGGGHGAQDGRGQARPQREEAVRPVGVGVFVKVRGSGLRCWATLSGGRFDRCSDISIPPTQRTAPATGARPRRRRGRPAAASWPGRSGRAPLGLGKK